MVGTFYASPGAGREAVRRRGRPRREGTDRLHHRGDEDHERDRVRVRGRRARGPRRRTRSRSSTDRCCSGSTRMAKPTATSRRHPPAAPRVPARRAAGATRVQLQGGPAGDGPAQRLRPAPQGRPSADASRRRRARSPLDHAAAAAGRSEGARRAADDAAAGEGVRREQGVRLRHRRAGHRPLPRATCISSAGRSATRCAPFRIRRGRSPS